MPEFRTSAYGTPCGATWALGTVWDRTGKIFKPWFRNWCSQPAARWGFSLSFRSVFKASGPRRPLILACLLVSVHAAILGGAGTQRVAISPFRTDTDGYRCPVCSGSCGSIAFLRTFCRLLLATRGLVLLDACPGTVTICLLCNAGSLQSHSAVYRNPFPFLVWASELSSLPIFGLRTKEI